MIIGQTLHATDADTGSPTPVYSPWFARGGDQGEFTCEIIYQSTKCLVEIDIETKNSEELDSQAGAPTSGGSMAADGGFMKSSATGFKELVRFKYTISWDNDGGDKSDFVILRMLYPQWLPN